MSVQDRLLYKYNTKYRDGLNTFQYLLLWDAKGYYCDERCRPDTDQALWLLASAPHFSIDETLKFLSDYQPTHLMFSFGDLGWYIRYHDPTDVHFKAARFLVTDFQTACLDPIFEGENAVIYELTCP